MRLSPAVLVALVCSAGRAAAEVYEIRAGDDLAGRLAALGPGDEVIVHAGEYAVPGPLAWAGAEAAPIVVRAAPDERPILVGAAGSAVLALAGSHFALRGFELRGGARGVSLGAVDHATLTDLVLRELTDAGIACDGAAAACASLSISRSEIRDAAVGVVVGCGAVPCEVRDVVIEDNYLHDLGAGILVDTGAAAVAVRDNAIFRAGGAGIAARGFEGDAAPHAIERNLVWGALDDGIQLVGQARVRNNVIFGAAVYGLHSLASGGHAPLELELANNTVVGAGVACLAAHDWIATTGQLVANNALYCEGGVAIELAGGAPAARLVANVGRGASNAPAGFALGRSAGADFADVSVGDVYPVAGSPLEDAGDGALAPDADFDGCGRPNGAVEVGAYERGVAGARRWDLAEGFKPPATCGAGDGDGDGGGCCDARGGRGGRGGAASAGLLAVVVALATGRRRRRGGGGEKRGARSSGAERRSS